MSKMAKRLHKLLERAAETARTAHEGPLEDREEAKALKVLPLSQKTANLTGC